MGNSFMQCNVPAWQLSSGLTYIVSLPNPLHAFPLSVLQASFDGSSLRFTSLAGDVGHQFEAVIADRLDGLRARLTNEAGAGHSRIDVMSPGRALMCDILRESPLATLG